MSESEFRTTLASRFSSIDDVSRFARDEPLTALARSDLSSVLERPTLDLPTRPFPFEPPVRQPPTTSHPPTAPPLTPGEADAFIGTVAETPEQAIAAAVHAARTAFEAIPTAQNGDVIDASIPNGFRSALITLLSLADATVQQIVYRQPPRPVPPRPLPLPDRLPPRPTPEPIPPRETPPIGVTPPIRIDPGAIPTPASVLPPIDLGGRIFEAATVTHPETSEVTTIFVERPATGLASAALAPVAGGGFHLTGLSTTPRIG